MVSTDQNKCPKLHAKKKLSFRTKPAYSPIGIFLVFRIEFNAAIKEDENHGLRSSKKIFFFKGMNFSTSTENYLLKKLQDLSNTWLKAPKVDLASLTIIKSSDKRFIKKNVNIYIYSNWLEDWHCSNKSVIWAYTS